MALEKDGQVYKLGDLAVARLNQDTAAYAYLVLKSEGMLENFYNQGVPDLATFLSGCFAPQALSLGGFVTGSDGKPTLAGIGLLPSIESHPNGVVVKSEVSEVFLRQYQRRSITIPLAKMMLEYVFDNIAVTVVYGTTPEHNRAALMFMKALGFSHAKETIPHYTTWRGEECGSYVSWLTRTRWRELKWF